MKPLKTLVAFAGAFCIAASPMCYAEIASGTYTKEFNGELNLWDISGSYTENLEDISLSYTLNMDPSGKFTGSGSFYYDVGWSGYLSGSFTVSGSVKSAGNVTRVSLLMNIGGDGNIEGYDATFTASVKEQLEIDTGTRQMLGSASGKLTVTVPGFGKKSASIPRSVASATLPAQADGNWSLTLDIVPSGTKYAGTATVDLSNGKSFDLTLSGNYSAKKDVSKLVLKGLDRTVPISLSLKALCSSTDMSVQSLKGKGLGQKLKATY